MRIKSEGKLNEEFNKNQSDWDKHATVGWVKQVTNRELSLPLFKEAIDYGIDYLGSKLKEHEGIELDNSLLLTREYTAVLLHGVDIFYDKNPHLLHKSNISIINNFYNQGKSDNKTVKTVLITIVMTVFLNSLSGVVNQISLDSYEALKKYYSNETIINSDSIHDKLTELEKVEVYSENSKKSVSTTIYNTNEMKIQQLSETDKWHHILVINHDNEIITGYICKSDIEQK